MDIDREITDLKRRVGDLEGAVNVLAAKVGSVHPDLVSIKDMSFKRFNAIDSTMDDFVKRLDKVSTQVFGLRDELPELLGTAVARALARKKN